MNVDYAQLIEIHGADRECRLGGHGCAPSTWVSGSERGSRPTADAASSPRRLAPTLSARVAGISKAKRWLMRMPSR